MLARPVLPAPRAIENVLTSRNLVPRWPPIFVVGPSRSGSTLVSQAMTYALNLGYISNAMMVGTRFPVCRCLAALLRYGRARPADFRSKHGLTDGPTGVNTGSRMWLRAFRDQNGKVQRNLSDEAAGRVVSAIIALISKYYDAPVANKWSGNSALLPAIAALFREAVFVRVRRDPLDIAQSILTARRSSHGDPYRPLISWPGDFDQPAGCHYTEQIPEHILRIETMLDEAMTGVGADRFIEVHYRHVCTDPNTEMRRLAEKYERRLHRPLPFVRNLPESFEYSQGKTIDDADYEALKRNLQRRGMLLAE